MRWYFDFAQPAPASDKCPICKSPTCRNAPTVREKERSLVLQISREKLGKRNKAAVDSDSYGVDDSASLRKHVAVVNTVRRLEEDINAEIMAAFSAPVSIG